MRKKHRKKRQAELDDMLRFTKITNRFKAVERLIWFAGVERRECDGEHSFQLAIMAWFVNERCELGLDAKLLLEYALVHDLPETYAGDTPAFVKNGHGAETPNRAAKIERERASMRRIEAEWNKAFPSLIERLRAYEAQEDEESRFIYALDKLLATMNVMDDGGRANRILGISAETYDLYKRPRIARHPHVLELYEELFAKMLARKDSMFAT